MKKDNQRETQTDIKKKRRGSRIEDDEKVQCGINNISREAKRSWDRMTAIVSQLSAPKRQALARSTTSSGYRAGVDTEAVQRSKQTYAQLPPPNYENVMGMANTTISNEISPDLLDRLTASCVTQKPLFLSTVELSKQPQHGGGSSQSSFRAVDANGDDKVDRDEFRTYFTRKAFNDESRAAMVVAADHVFSMLDKDGNGYIDEGEWRELEEGGEHMIHAIAKEMGCSRRGMFTRARCVEFAELIATHCDGKLQHLPTAIGQKFDDWNQRKDMVIKEEHPRFQMPDTWLSSDGLLEVLRYIKQETKTVGVWEKVLVEIFGWIGFQAKNKATRRKA